VRLSWLQEKARRTLPIENLSLDTKKREEKEKKKKEESADCGRRVSHAGNARRLSIKPSIRLAMTLDDCRREKGEFKGSRTNEP